MINLANLSHIFSPPLIGFHLHHLSNPLLILNLFLFLKLLIILINLTTLPPTILTLLCLVFLTYKVNPQIETLKVFGEVKISVKFSRRVQVANALVWGKIANLRVRASALNFVQVCIIFSIQLLWVLQ